MQLLHDIKAALLHLAFPHVCAGCGSDALEQEHALCLYCLNALPLTRFHLHPDNPVEKAFWGRLPICSATAQYYFTRGSLIQRLMHRLKYRGDQALGLYLGQLMGLQLAQSDRFRQADALLPLPLAPARERKRGYNQAALLCQGIAEVLQKPVLTDAIARTAFTESQTKKNRVERWQNIEGRFRLTDEKGLEGRHLLLVDDVITTGATLEACGRELLRAGGTQLSIATLCFSSA